MLKHELNSFLNFSYENAANSMSWRKPTSRVWLVELFTSAATSSWRPTASLELYRFNQETLLTNILLKSFNQLSIDVKLQ